VYLSMSEHEGFCLPVMESFKMGLPVAAYDAGAIRETVGEGGVIFDTKDPEKVAGTLEYLINNGQVREKLINAGKERLERYAEDSNPLKLLELIRLI
ncbi:MAG: glycosyltransferase, partial [Candidatus Aminicenantes bacterium]|nr:glycosyltransferase [Candidatus Aminicenantes bacterium]